MGRPDDEIVRNSRRIFVGPHPLSDALAVRKLSLHRALQLDRNIPIHIVLCRVHVLNRWKPFPLRITRFRQKLGPLHHTNTHVI